MSYLPVTSQPRVATSMDVGTVFMRLQGHQGQPKCVSASTTMYPYGVVEHNVSLYPVQVWCLDSVPTVYLCTILIAMKTK